MSLLPPLTMTNQQMLISGSETKMIMASHLNAKTCRPRARMVVPVTLAKKFPVPLTFAEGGAFSVARFVTSHVSENKCIVQLNWSPGATVLHATASGWTGDRSGVFDVPCAVEHDMSMSAMQQQLVSITQTCTEGNGVGKSIKPSVNKKNQNVNAHKHDGGYHLALNQPIHIHFKYRLTDKLEGVWSTILHGKSLYVHIPQTTTNGEGSKDSFIRLLEYAEEKLKADNVVAFFQEGRNDAPSWMRAFMFLGFQLLPPKHPLRPDNHGFIYMNYLID